MSYIFISIASYRDPELVPTVEDCLKKAKYPDRLRFGICWQKDENEVFPYIKDNRFSVLPVDWKDSKGACWARSKIQEFYNDEEFYFQLDSHHRFAPEWDEKLIAMLDKCDSEKPILTAYANSYNPNENKEYHELKQNAWQMNWKSIDNNGIIIFIPSSIKNNPGKPIPARFFSGHMTFTSGEFVKEVPYDPNLYFIGEEITLAVRAYTHGWDLFHPNENLVWHEYTRKGRTKHWSDHVDRNGIKVPWYKIDRESKKRAKSLLVDNEDLGIYGFGNKRTLYDYERYAGVSFKLKQAETHTLEGLAPPSPLINLKYDEWIKSFAKKYVIDVNFAKNRLDNRECDFWYFGCHDKDGKELLRQDIPQKEIRSIINDSDIVSFKKEFLLPSEPYTYTVWQYSKKYGWLNKIKEKVS